MASDESVPKPSAVLEAVTDRNCATSAADSFEPKGDVSGNDSKSAMERAFLAANRLLGAEGFWHGTSLNEQHAASLFDTHESCHRRNQERQSAYSRAAHAARCQVEGDVPSHDEHTCTPEHRNFRSPEDGWGRAIVQKDGFAGYTPGCYFDPPAIV